MIRLSKEDGIVTPYTAYLVEEPASPRSSSVRGRIVQRLGFQDGRRADWAGGGSAASRARGERSR